MEKENNITVIENPSPALLKLCRTKQLLYDTEFRKATLNMDCSIQEMATNKTYSYQKGDVFKVVRETETMYLLEDIIGIRNYFFKSVVDIFQENNVHYSFFLNPNADPQEAKEEVTKIVNGKIGNNGKTIFKTE